MPSGRPPNYDRSEVLDRALDFFWAHGYKAGLTDLLRSVGVGRQTLYNLFGSKRALFIEVIHRYREKHLAAILAHLAEGNDPLGEVRKALHFFEQLAVDKRSRGCLVANAIVEVGAEDEEIAALLRETLGLLESAVRDALKRARDRGELAPGREPRALARALSNAMIGMAVTGRLGGGRGALRDIYQGTLQMLR